MFLKCPSCKERMVLEEKTGRLEWRRLCVACGHVYTIQARTETLDDSLLAEIGQYQAILDR